MHQPQRVENAKILIANTPMDTDKIKVFVSRVKVDNVAKASTHIYLQQGIYITILNGVKAHLVNTKIL